MEIYVARPITGLDYYTVANYFCDVRDVLAGYGYTVLLPFAGKGYLKGKTNFKAEGEMEHPPSTGHALTLRDRWMVTKTDILYLNLLEATKVSIGCMMELAWAYDHGKHCVVVMEPDNLHQHAFVREAAHVVFATETEALEYLKKLAAGEL